MPAYVRAVERARHGFIFYRETLPTVPVVDELERFGYAAFPVGTFVVYAPAGARSPSAK